MRLGWIPVIALLLLPTRPPAAQETVEDPAVAKSMEILDRTMGSGQNLKIRGAGSIWWSGNLSTPRSRPPCTLNSVESIPQ
jgi:hypothetical protein